MKHTKVLLVDDEVELAQTLAQRLTLRKYRTRAIYSAAEALDAVRSDKPDVMIIDLHLPGMLGTDLAREVKQADSTVAVIMLSGQGSKQTESWIRDGLIFDFVMKPVAIQELTKKIDSARKEHDARCARSETGHGKRESSRAD